MLDQLSKLEENVSSSSMSKEKKAEILADIDALRLEYISSKEISHPFKKAFSKLRKSIYEFEKEHPFLVKNINEISSMLSNMGI
jgi:hypothetical protein